MRTRRWFLLLTALMAIAAHGSMAIAKPVPQEAAAQDFWSAFRTAAKKKDKDALLGFANFPFVIRWGNADPNDPTVSLNRRELAAAIDQVLAIRTGESDPASPPMSKAIAEITDVPPNSATSGEFVVESFEFRRIKGAWRWTTAFTTDPAFYPTADSFEVPRESPLRKLLIDAAAKAMNLHRPLTVKHLMTNGRVAYIDVQEPGKSGRRARAFLQRQPDDASGKTSFLVKQNSFLPSNGDDSEWQEKVEALKKSGAPASVFPTVIQRQEGDAHAR